MNQKKMKLVSRTLNIFLIATLLAGLFLSTRPVEVSRAATTITVDSFEDKINTDGFCTLREAIISANKDAASSGAPGECLAGSGADTIILPPGVYTLSRNDSGREDSASTGDLDITKDVTILAPNGPVTINAISGFKDRIFHILGGVVVIDGLTISSGNPSRDGGGVYNQGSLTIRNSTIAANATGANGGGIYNASSLTLINVTLSGNNAKVDGGGLYHYSNTSHLNNVTISANTADSDANKSGDGGGIFRSSGTVNIENSLIAGNFDLSSTTTRPDCAGTLNSQGYNLVQNTSGCTLSGITTGNLTGINPNLGPLQNNGGNTFTHAFPAGSPAVDAGNPASAENLGACAETDQRGIARPQGLFCDMGAFELEIGDPPQPGPTRTVNVSEDSDDGVCGQLHCSLREAINASNASPNGAGPDEIIFDIPQNPTPTLAPLASLPEVTEPVVIDGAGSVTIDGSQAGTSSNGLAVTAGSSTLKGLAVQFFGGDGINLSTGDGNTIENNSITQNGGAGVWVLSGRGNAIRNNSIVDNTGLGIDLGTQGAEVNDTGDGDTGPNDLQNHPVLVRAVPSGGTLLVTGRLNSLPNREFTLEFFANTVCDPSGAGEGQTSLGTLSLTTDNLGDKVFSQALAVDVPTGTFITATATDADKNTSEFSPCLPVDLGNDSWFAAHDLGSNQLTEIEQSLDRPGQSRWYKFKVNPGTKLFVTLTNLPANYDLTLYKDIAVAFNSLTSPADLNRLGAEFAPDAFSPDAFSPEAFSPDAFSPEAFSPEAFSPEAFSPEAFSPEAFSPEAFSPEAFSPEAFSPDAFSPEAFSPEAFSPEAFSPEAFSPEAFSPEAFSSAQTRSLIAVSAFEGTAGEGVVVNTWDNDGYFYVRVRGRNSAYSLSNNYHLSIFMPPGSCTNVSASLPPSSITPQSAGFKTIILTDFTRMEGTQAEKDDLLARLQDFALRPEVQGVIVEVSSDARVLAANQQADAHPSCPYAKNLVASSIKEIVDGHTSINPLEYIVIVGNDEVIPFFRHPDQSGLANEKSYVPPVLDSTASQASLKLGYVLSQDRYGASLSISVKDDTFPIPDLAVGRLVETPAEVKGMLEAYLSTSSGLMPTPTSTLITGYDFLHDAAIAVQDELEAGTGVAADSLLTPSNIAPTDPSAWTADQLRAQLLGERHDIIFLAGHFSAHSALAADYQTRFLASELVASNVDLVNALVFSAGCHSGYNVVNLHAVSGVTVQPDWAQAFARKQANLIAGTGYQYGDTDFIEYSERLYLEFSRQLRSGSGPVAIGKALAAAKRAYLANTATLRGIHEKSLLEATLFGFPMLAVDMPGARFTPPSDPSIVTSTNAYSNDPGLTLGLRYQDVTVTPSLSERVVQLDVVGGNTTVDATYLTGSDGIVANPGEPVLPLETYNVSVPNLVMRGLGFLGGDYSDHPDVLPLLGAATTEVRGVHTPFLSDVFYPVRLWSANYFDSLSDPLDGATRLVLTPAHFMSTAPGDSRGTLRQFNSMSFRLFYSNHFEASNSGNVPALAAAPTIAHISATPGSSEVQFRIQVIGDPAAGIQEVWVTYTALSGPYAGSWQSLTLAQNPSDSTLWEGLLPLNGTDAGDLRYLVQAVNGVGLVTLAANLGAYYTPGAEPNPTIPTEVALENPPASGAYGSKVSFSAVLTSAGQPLAGQLVVFGLGPQSRIAFTDAAGRASATLALLGVPGQTEIQVSFGGTPDYLSTFDTRSFEITRQATSLTINPAPVLGQYSDAALTTVTLTDITTRRLGQQTVLFSATNNSAEAYAAEITDYAGRATLPALSLPAGVYDLTAFYGGQVTIDGQTIDLESDLYTATTATTSLDLQAEDSSVIYTGDTAIIVGSDVNLSASVSQADDGYPGDLTLAQVLFEARDNTNTVVATQTAPVDAAGLASVALGAILPAGTYQIDVTVTGGFFTSPTTSATLQVGNPPDCSLAEASPNRLWPPNHQFITIEIVNVFDPDGDIVTITVTSVYQDEKVGTDEHSPDAQGVGTSTPQLRAERDQNGNGRVYHIFFTADDGLGGSCTGEVLAGVSPDQGGQQDPIDDGALYDSAVPMD